jgi:purine-binding chemotaxis protein CheW
MSMLCLDSPVKERQSMHDDKDSKRSSEPTQEFLTFTLGLEEYAIDILRVQEIRGYDQVTAIANSPAFIKGVINLRGAIVPIVDLRIKFNLSSVTYDQFTVVIILNVLKRIIGVVVDSVSDVIALADEAIRPPPEFGSTFNTEYLKGLATVEERMLILVDIEKLMSSGEMALLNEAVD